MGPLMTDPAPLEAELLSQPTNQLLDAFGAGHASPGSRSAAALMGLLAVKLIRTVCLKSLQKNPERNTEITLRHLLDELGAIESSLRALFEKDAREFDEVVRQRMARDAATDPDVKSSASRRANDVLENATDNTFEIMDLCLRLIDHGVTVFEHGWQSVRGDSGAAVSAAIAAVTSGLFIANLNIKRLKERNYARDNIDRCATILVLLQQKQQTALGCVTSLNAEALDSLSIDGTVSLQLPLEFASAQPSRSEDEGPL